MTRRRFWLRLVVAVVVVAVLAAGLATAWAYRTLNASLAMVEGEAALPGLSVAATVDRDASGIPTIRAASRVDLARALGFLHAQDRFFQMDLQRRQAAGELAELVGAGALEMDRTARLHRKRARAVRVVEAAAPEHRRLLAAYSEGVNRGLASLGAMPFEYYLLRSRPVEWKPEDSLLVLYAMFFTLNDSRGAFESDWGLVEDLLPAELARFLNPARSEWDAPLFGEEYVAMTIPGPEVRDLRGQASAAARIGPVRIIDEIEPFVGSNNWAVAGTRTTDGRAMVADDMHLGISVPIIWYRAVMESPDLWLAGVTLPGIPILVAGSNGHVAWGFTNSTGDWTDLVVLETDPERPDHYLTPEGWRPFEVVRETIRIQGGEPEILEIRETVWGPVIDEDHRGRLRALRWIAHDPQAVNLLHLRVETARDLDQAVSAAHGSGIPPQNFVCADRSGRIAWTIEGAIPVRTGLDGRVPTSWADGSRGWSGWLAPEDFPRVIDPPDGIIWTANARVVDGPMLQQIGDGGYDLGARARQIRDGLARLEAATEADMLAIQLDDRALLIERWKDLALAVLGEGAIRDHPRRAEFRRMLQTTWTGRASVDSVAYRLARAFRLQTLEVVYGWLTAECREADPRFRPHRLGQWEDPLWALVTKRPAHLLDPAYESWEAALLAAVDRVLEATPGDLASRTWGERNTIQPRHPLTRALSFLSPWLDMPARQLPGDSHMPRVQWLDGGASQRFAVSPGREVEGIFHMPCGQSGHPWSPYYRSGHEDWAEGRAASFLPGEPGKRLVLRPELEP